MDSCTPQPSRRHNPVDSICRKLRAIQWRGDREPNTPFQIPKLSSSSFDSPLCGLRHNLEAILKSGAFHRDEGGMGTPISGPSVRFSTPANATYTVTSSSGERRGLDEGDSRRARRQSHCSTATTQPKDSPYFAFAGGPHSDRTSRSPPLSRTFTPSNGTPSYNVNFCAADSTNWSECELLYPALVVKRLSMGDRGPGAAENRRKMADISLICEENLLDTIFHVCDTQRRGKVYVSHIVDYLRHTTSRSSGDTGLEELCNMLDPEHKDVSIDLDTYHAVMREWIDDCHNNGQETVDNLQEDSVKHKDGVSARRSMLLNMTSGSLEALGGDVSGAELETSELVNCVADLQMSNHKLQEEVKKLKQVMESMEESNQKLAEENEQLRHRATVNQQLAQKEEMLKEEVEEMKASLTCTEEGRARASAHSKHMEKENRSLIAKIASLQEENFKVIMETDELQNKIKELCDLNADLQMKIHALDAVITEKESVILEKSRQVEDLKAAVEEQSAITELLKKDKNKLENQMRTILPDLAGASLSLAYRPNQSCVRSLQTELALAQSPLEADLGVEHLTNVQSPLDETLDRGVLLMLQGPSPEHTPLEFECLLNKLKRDLTEETGSVLSLVQDLLNRDTKPDDASDARLQRVKAELESRRADWLISLDQLAQYVDALEKELIKTAGSMRRSRTEILNLSDSSNSAACTDPELCPQTLQDEAAEPVSAHTQAVSMKHPEADDLSHTQNNAEEVAEFRSDSSAPTPSFPPKPEQTIASADPAPADQSTAPADPAPADPSTAPADPSTAPANPSTAPANQSTAPADQSTAPADQSTAPADPAPADPSTAPADTFTAAADLDSPSSASPRPEEATTQTPSAPLTGEDHRGDDRPAEADSSAADMSRHKILSREPSMDKTAVEDCTSLLPVLVEEEEIVQDCATDAPTLSAGTDQITRSGPNIISEKSDPSSGSSVIRSSQSGGGMSNATSDPSSPELGEDKKDKLNDKNKKELTRSMEKVQDETGEAPRRESETSVISDNEDVFKEDRNSLSPSDKEIEAEFQRLALGFKCDMFTLEKRLRLEERSRDLAEENVRREVSSCQGLLQALIPLCEDDSQSMEIIQRLQKNLDILIQSMTRVSSRSEMLGAIHQEKRIGKAVEVMIQHVENLRRTYTKEHAELLELREALMQSERSFGSQTEKDDFRGKKQLQNKSSRRGSQPIVRASGGSMQFDMAKLQDGFETDAERLTRRSPWNVAGKSMTRPPLKRFVSSAAWVDTEEPSVMMKGPPSTNSDCQSEDEPKEEELAERRRSSLSELGSKLTSFILPLKTSQDELFVTLPSSSSTPTSTDPGVPPPSSHNPTGSRPAAAAVARGSRGLWMWLAILVVLAGLLALLAHLVMQPAADAAPVGTGDSWMTIQQLLWPYAGLRHNGQPPV
ncbi:inositol 1,4,5-triphosphate receptor associated 2 [Nematolebias whitei]|uniref:inositol 1,4,5-triphosphate receptor associated 2 n=1 Tax=Nematolebias whitei TaxID=451745 RepID=UPI001897CAD5|nr:inositol 1,4,5-triphosphate receptor associated 2 [Nematolebias whitei]